MVTVVSTSAGPPIWVQVVHSLSVIGTLAFIVLCFVVLIRGVQWLSRANRRLP